MCVVVFPRNLGFIRRRNLGFVRSRANSARIKQSGPEVGHVFQVKQLATFKLLPT